MLMTCNDICRQFKTVPMNWRGEKKYCTTCEYNIVTSELRCPCCNYVYRVNRKKFKDDYVHIKVWN